MTQKSNLPKRNLEKCCLATILCPSDRVTLDTYDQNIVEVTNGNRECCELLLKVEKAIK